MRWEEEAVREERLSCRLRVDHESEPEPSSKARANEGVAGTSACSQPGAARAGAAAYRAKEER